VLCWDQGQVLIHGRTLAKGFSTGPHSLPWQPWVGCRSRDVSFVKLSGRIVNIWGQRKTETPDLFSAGKHPERTNTDYYLNKLSRQAYLDPQRHSLDVESQEVPYEDLIRKWMLLVDWKAADCMLHKSQRSQTDPIFCWVFSKASRRRGAFSNVCQVI
jgi:hypothetical protein